MGDSDKLAYRTRPCAQCPWRRDVDLAVFGDDDFAKLASTDGAPGHEAPMGAPIMACHRDQPDTSHPMRPRSGWLYVVGPDHLRIRLNVATGRLPAEALMGGDDWPERYEDLDEMLDHRPEDTLWWDRAGPG